MAYAAVAGIKHLETHYRITNLWREFGGNIRHRPELIGSIQSNASQFAGCPVTRREAVDGRHTVRTMPQHLDNLAAYRLAEKSSNHNDHHQRHNPETHKYDQASPICGRDVPLGRLLQTTLCGFNSIICLAAATRIRQDRLNSNSLKPLGAPLLAHPFIGTNLA